MPARKDKKATLSKREYCDLCHKSCVNALSALKTSNKEAYKDEVESLSETCAHLIKKFKKTPQLLIRFMSVVMNKAHKNQLQDLEEQIAHLVRKRTQTPPGFCGEQEIMKLSTQITSLEKSKRVPKEEVEEAIQEIIYDSLQKAVCDHHIDMPEGFNLDRYKPKEDLRNI